MAEHDPEGFDAKALLSHSKETSSRVYKKSTHYRDVASALGKRVRHLRKARGWTLDAAARRMRIDLKHLQKIEAGGLNVTLVTLVRVARGFRVPVEFLFGHEAVEAVSNDESVFEFVKKKLESAR